MKGIGYFENLRNVVDFFWRNFLEGFLWEFFLGVFFGEYFFGRLFCEEFFERNDLVEINKELMFMSRF